LEPRWKEGHWAEYDWGAGQFQAIAHVDDLVPGRSQGTSD
jgi:hypothetical protein